MFEKLYEHRLASWRAFRNRLELSNDPLQEVIDFYNNAPNVSVHTDPWDNSMWPGPWELINENQYCEFSRVLGQCYSLQLTERFKETNFEIHISTDNSLSIVYLLYVGDLVIGWDDKTYVHKDKISTTFMSQKAYIMPSLQ